MKYTIKDNVRIQIKIQRSEFLGFLYRVENVSQLQPLLRAHQAEYQNATHNCYAYVLGYDSEIQYYSDAGEPGGTAGKPILNSLLRHDLSGVLAVVTRYYGGIKLGVKGLIDAYTQATTDAIAAAVLQEYQKFCYYRLECDYPQLESLRHQLSIMAAEELGADYTQMVSLSIRIRESKDGILREFLDGYKVMGRLDYYSELL